MFNYNNKLTENDIGLFPFQKLLAEYALASTKIFKISEKQPPSPLSTQPWTIIAINTD